MKGWLFAVVLFVGILLSGAGATLPDGCASLPGEMPATSVTEQDNPDSTERRLSVLSSELKSRSCVLPRQTTVQWVHSVANERTSRSLEKTLQRFRLQRDNRLYKVCEAISNCQTSNYFTLFFRWGNCVFTLRKLLN